MGPLIAVALIGAAGFPLAFAITRAPLLAGVVAPMVSAIIATAAVLLMLIFGGQLRWWLAAVYLAHLGLVWLLLRRHRGGSLPCATLPDVLCYTLPLLPPLLLVLAPPLEWDAHSIWWLHAAYFNRGGEYARDAIGNPQLMFSHTDYPPLPSALVAAGWALVGQCGFRVAQAIAVLVTASVIATLGYAVRRANHKASPVVARMAAIGVSLAVWGATPTAVTGGLADPLWAAAFTAAAILLLLGDDPLARPALPIALLSVTALSKNESVTMTIALAVAVTMKHRRQLRRLWPIWIPAAAGPLWTVISRHLGAQSDVPVERIPLMLSGEPSVLARFSPTAAAIWDTVGGLIVVALVTAVVGGLFLRRRRRALGLGSDLWLWAMAATYCAALTTTYVVSPIEINWYLTTSIPRVTLPFALLAAASAACWGVTAASAPPRADDDVGR